MLYPQLLSSPHYLHSLAELAAKARLCHVLRAHRGPHTDLGPPESLEPRGCVFRVGVEQP